MTNATARPAGRKPAKQVAPATLWLAHAQDWAHRDGTCATRVHVALTAADAEGYVWCLRGSSQGRNRNSEVVSTPDRVNNLLKTTYWVVEKRALVRLHTSQLLRNTGKLATEKFHQVWDAVEAAKLNG